MKQSLHQIIAVDSGIKTRVYAKLSEDHKALQKDDLFRGHNKTYKPKDEDPTSPTGEQLPPDTKNVQVKARNVIAATMDGLSEYWNINFAREYGNSSAKADVVVNGKTLLKDAPVTYLLFLEKQLDDIHTFVKKLPTLDSAEQWTYSPEQGMYASAPSETARTKKLTRPLVLYAATKEHPAQVKEVQEDVFAGTWTTRKYSAALPADEVNAMLRRVEDLQQAVKFARQKANELEVQADKPARSILEFVFGT